MNHPAAPAVLAFALLAPPNWAQAQGAAFPQEALASMGAADSANRAPGPMSGGISFPGVPAPPEASASDRVTVAGNSGAVPFSSASAYALRPDASVPGVWFRHLGFGAPFRTAAAR